jgi:hypothetical protein
MSEPSAAAAAEFDAAFVRATLARHAIDAAPPPPAAEAPQTPRPFVRRGADWYLDLAFCEPDLDDL